jgi:hypothetical protein
MTEHFQGPINIAGGYYSSNDIYGFIVYLQTGNCGANGEVLTQCDV